MHRKVSQRVVSVLALAALLLGLLPGMALAGAAAAPVQAPALGGPVGAVDDGQVAVKASKPSLPQGDVRLIVRLAAPSLALYQGGIAGQAPTAVAVTGATRLDVAAPASQAYLSYLAAQQQVVISRLTAAIPGAQVQYRYGVTLNGFAVKVPASRIEDVRKLAGVTSAVVEQEYQLTMDASLAIVGLGSGVVGDSWTDSGLWTAVGGHDKAGLGLKIADIDSGMTIANPCFDPTGYSYPAGFPKFGGGYDAFVSPKIIVARAYFRPDDPPFYAPNPADDPAPDGGHGDHTAGTMACDYGTTTTFPNTGSTFTKISGVATKAQLMNYKVFYRSTKGGSSAWDPELIQAIEDAVADGADVVNNSWGGTAITPPDLDPVVAAYGAAVDAGLIVVFSNGNAGPGTMTVGHPAYSDKFISVGAHTTDRIFANPLNVTGPATATITSDLLNISAMPGSGPAASTIFSATYKMLSTSDIGCAAYPAGFFAGKIALINRGTCTFETKITNATTAGAIAVVIANNVAGPPSAMSVGAATSVPSWMVNLAQGTLLKTWWSTYPTNAALQVLPVLNRYTDPLGANLLASFSSRGPTPSLGIKPDLTAPGVNILSSVSGTSFALYQGTSMAAPHVTGAAALLKQLNPTWRQAEIKSALMSTAKEPASLGANPQDRGAGRLWLESPNNPGLLFDNPSLSFGVVATGERVTKTVVARNATSVAATYTVTVVASSGADVPTVSVSSLPVPANGSASFQVVLQATAAGQAYGKVVLTDGTLAHTLHIPYWARRVTNLGAADVFLINDSAETGCTDYLGVYTNTLTSLGYTYVVWNVAANGFLIDFNQARRYSKVVYFSGDAGCGGYLSIQGNPNQPDTVRSFLANGGKMLITGQDVAYWENYFRLVYGWTYYPSIFFGEQYVQDTLFPVLANVPNPAIQGDTEYSTYLAHTYYDIRPGGDGAGNQNTVDEIYPSFYTDADTLPILRSSAVPSMRADGYVGTRASSEPTIERVKGTAPWTPERFRTEFLSFGIEGVNNVAGPATTGNREDLMMRLLAWLDDEVSVSFNAGGYAVAAPNLVVNVGATAVTTIPTLPNGYVNTIQYYRWDFGDGTPVQQTSGPTNIHGYAKPGVYTVLVEVMDGFGHKAVSQPVRITVGQQTYLPFVAPGPGIPSPY